MNRRALSVSLIFLILLTLAAGLLSVYNLHQQLPYHQWRSALWQPDIDDVQQMLFHIGQQFVGLIKKCLIKIADIHAHAITSSRVVAA